MINKDEIEKNLEECNDAGYICDEDYELSFEPIIEEEIYFDSEPVDERLFNGNLELDILNEFFPKKLKDNIDEKIYKNCRCGWFGILKYGSKNCPRCKKRI